MRLLIGATVVVVIISLVGWWMLLYSPAREQQMALQAEITDLEAREQQLVNQRQQLVELQDRAPQIRRSLDRLNQFIPPDPDQASFLELLQLAGNAAGITFTGLTFTDPLPVEGAPSPADPRLVLGQITVQGTIESGYFQLVDFLRRMEIEVPRAVLVQQVDITESEDGFPEVTTTFTAQMFALIAAPVVDTPEGAAPPAPATPGPTPTPVPGTTPPTTATPPANAPTPPPTDPAQSPQVPDAGAPADGDIQTSALPPDARQTTTPPATTGQPA